MRRKTTRSRIMQAWNGPQSRAKCCIIDATFELLFDWAKILLFHLLPHFFFFFLSHVHVCELPDMPYASNCNEKTFNGPTVSINIINMLLENDNSDLSYWNEASCLCKAAVFWTSSWSIWIVQILAGNNMPRTWNHQGSFVKQFNILYFSMLNCAQWELTNWELAYTVF